MIVQEVDINTKGENKNTQGKDGNNSKEPPSNKLKKIKIKQENNQKGGNRKMKHQV